MATKKSPQKTAAKNQKAKAPSVTARIDRLIDIDGNKMKAVASANIAGYAVHGIKVMDSEKGLFVSMPQSKYQKDGKTEYSDIFHPVTADSRTELENAVLAAYEQKLQEEQGQDMDAPEEAEENTVEQTM